MIVISCGHWAEKTVFDRHDGVAARAGISTLRRA